MTSKPKTPTVPLIKPTVIRREIISSILPYSTILKLTQWFNKTLNKL